MTFWNRRSERAHTINSDMVLRTPRMRKCHAGAPDQYDSVGGGALAPGESEPSTQADARRRARIVAVVCAAVFLSVLNGTIVNVVLPTIGQELAVEPALLGWVVTAYSLVYAVAIPFFGRFADLFGARRLFVAGQAVFAIGSLLCVLAPSFPLLIVARIIQSAGGAAIPGLGMTLATRAYPPHQIGVVVGLMSTGVGVAQAIGPTLGGVVASAFGWQAAFAVGALAGLLVPASFAWLPRTERTTRAPQPHASHSTSGADCSWRRRSVAACSA
jgi:MFS family permease